MKHVELIFDELGHFKRFQACLYFAAAFQAIACGAHYLSSVFLAETPKFLCASPGDVTGALYGNHSVAAIDDVWAHYAPGGGGPVVVRNSLGEQWELSQCRRALRLNATGFEYQFDGNKTAQSCAGEFFFDRSGVEQSIVTDWGLVCEREWLAKLCQPVFMLGVLIGAVIFGDVADRVGRRRIMMLTSTCQFIFGVSIGLTNNYYAFMVLRFLLAMVSSGYLVVVFVYVTEFTGSKVRVWTSMHVHAFFAVGIMVVALVGYLVRVWWIYQIVLSLSTSPFLLFCWKFPETPFYLLTKGRYREAQDLLDSIARFNGLPATLKVADLLDSKADPPLVKGPEPSEEKPEKKYSMLDLFCSPTMACRTLIVWFVWFIGSLGYYVFSLGSVNLGGNQYINLFLAGAVEFPSYVIGCLAMERVGRKRTCSPALLLSGVVCMLIIFIPRDMEVLVVVLSMTGKFTVAIAFGLIYLYTCELYPTIIRSLAVGSGSMLCRLGSVVAPFCVYLADIWIYLPNLIVGVLAFAAGLMTLWLPETLGRPLTNTMEEAAALGSAPKPDAEEHANGEPGKEVELQMASRTEANGDWGKV